MVSEMRTSLSLGSRTWLSERAVEVVVCDPFTWPRSFEGLLLSVSFSAAGLLVSVEGCCRPCVVGCCLVWVWDSCDWVGEVFDPSPRRGWDPSLGATPVLDLSSDFSLDLSGPRLGVSAVFSLEDFSG